MNLKAKSLLGACALALSAQAVAGVTFYEGEGFRGRALVANGAMTNFKRSGFNDRAASVVIDSGRWEVCEHANFEGRCVVLRRGSYDSLNSIGLERQISSVRPVAANARFDNERPAPLAAPNYEWRRRPQERVFEAPVTSVRAVVADQGQRCWIDRERVSDRGDPNVGGAVLGAIIGGVLGHQVGSGRGNDAATVAGAVAGGAIGANTNRDGGGSYSRDVRRCENVSSGRPEYWDVTYNFRNQEHRIQMSAPPGPTIAVNQRGEPRQ